MMDWKTQYTAQDTETELELTVYCPNGLGWFFAAFDPVTEESCISGLPGFDDKETAMKAAEQWFSEWLIKVSAGSREMS